MNFKKELLEIPVQEMESWHCPTDIWGIKCPRWISEEFLHKPNNKHLNFQFFDTDTIFDSLYLSVSPTQTYSEH